MTKGTIFLKNVMKYPTSDQVSQPTKLQIAARLLQQPQNLHYRLKVYNQCIWKSIVEPLCHCPSYIHNTGTATTQQPHLYI